MDETVETLELNNDGTVELGAGGGANSDEDATAGNAANGTQAATHENGGEGEPNEGDDDGEALFQFGDEEAPPSEVQVPNEAPQWVKELRQQNRELTRKLREKEAQEQVQQPAQSAIPTLGEKPKLEEFDYDEEKYDAALGAWYAKKTEVDAHQRAVQEAEDARKTTVQERLNGYNTEAQALRVKDFRDVEGEVVQALSPTQQGILLSGADKPATLVYALGRHPAKLRELSKISDPVRFAFAAAKLEKELKVTTRNADKKPAPEGRVSSSSGAPAAGGGEKKLEQLRAEAEKTGDYTKVTAYKRQLKQAQGRR